MKFNLIAKFNQDVDRYVQIMWDHHLRCKFLAIRVTERNGEGLTEKLTNGEMMDIWLGLGMRLDELATFPSCVRALDGQGFLILYKFTPETFFPVYVDSVFFDLEEIRTQNSADQLVKFSCSVYFFLKYND
jgi:hypothetical protein